MTTLPTGIPRLDALVRAEAGQQTAGLLYHLERGIKARIDSATSDAQRVYWQSALDDIPPAVAVIDAFESLLRDLSRRESRDWAACALAVLVGVTVGATAPSWYWIDRRSDSTDRDGAPNGDGWPSGWWLMNNIGEACFFSGEPAEEWDPEMGHIVWIQGLPGRDENTAPALAQTLTTVCRSTP